MFFWLIFFYLIYSNLDGLKFNNSKWLGDSHFSEINLSLLQKKFQNYENLIISIDFKKNIFQHDVLNIIKNTSKQLLQVNNVSEVLSPLSASFLMQNKDNLEYTSYEKALDKAFFKDLSSYQNEFVSSPYYLKIISQDLQKISLIVKIDSVNNEYKREQAIEGIITILKNNKDLPNFKLAGNGFLNYELNKQSKDNLIKLTLMILIVICLLSFISGGLQRLVVVLGIVAITIGLSLFIIKFNGHFLTSISIALIIMVKIVGISDAFHIFSYYEYLCNKQNNDLEGKTTNQIKLSNIKLAIQKNYLPCFLTSLTTAVGFFSFVFSALVPLKNFAIDASLVIIVSFIFNLFYLFSVMYLLPLPSQKKQSKAIILYNKINLAILNKLANFSIIHYKKIVYVSILLVFVMLSSFPLAKTQSNFLDIFFAKNSNIYKNFIYLDEFFSGSGGINVIIKDDNVDYFRTYQSYVKIKEISDKFSTLENVKAVESFLLPLHMVHEKLSADNSKYPKNDNEIGQELLFLDLSRSDNNSGVMIPYMDFNYKMAHITLHSNNLQSDAIIKLLTSVEDILHKLDVNDFIITGNNEYFYRVSQDILNTQFVSIILCYLIIYIIFIIFFKLKLATFSIVSAIFPIVFVITSIILSFTAFDFAVVLVSSIGLGLAVDNTLHILHNYLAFNKQNITLDEKLKNAFIIPGMAIIQSSLLFSITSLIFIYSDLIMIKKFGIFLFICVAISFFSSTILFIAILKFFDKYINLKKNKLKDDINK